MNLCACMYSQDDLGGELVDRKVAIQLSIYRR